jgi:hypothetical protein
VFQKLENSRKIALNDEILFQRVRIESEKKEIAVPKL